MTVETKDKAVEPDIIVDPPLDLEPELPLEAADEQKKPDTKPDEPQKEAPKTDVESVDDLKAQLQAARERAALADRLAAERDAAITHARRFEAELVASKGSELVSQYETIVTGIKHHEAQKERAKAAIQEALETGDGKALAEWQDELTQINQRLSDMREGARQIEDEHERRQRQAQQPRQTARPDPMDAVRQEVARLSPASQQWVARNIQTWMDPQKKARIIRLDAVAQENGIQPDTPAYFAFIEEKMGLRAPSDGRQQSRPGYAAPVSREATGSPRPQQVRLTKEEMEIAESMGLSGYEWWKNKQEAAKRDWSVHQRKKV